MEKNIKHFRKKPVLWENGYVTKRKVCCQMRLDLFNLQWLL